MTPVDSKSSQAENATPAYAMLWIENKSNAAASPSEAELRKTLEQIPAIRAKEIKLEFVTSGKRGLLRVTRVDNQPVSPELLQQLIQYIIFNYDVAANTSIQSNAISYWLEPNRDDAESFTLHDVERLKQLESEINLLEDVIASGTQIKLVPGFPMPAMHISTWNGQVPNFAVINRVINYVQTTATAAYGAVIASGIFAAVLPESLTGGSGGSTTGTPSGGATNPIDMRASWRPSENNIVRQRFNANAATIGQPVDVYVIDTVPYATEADVLAKLRQFATSPNAQVQALVQSAVTNGRLKVDPTPVAANTSALSTTMDPDARWHGLYIAGIILSLTKNTTVHLVRAANEQTGYSSYPDIVDWLVNKAQATNPGGTSSPTPVIVNISMTTNPAPYRYIVNNRPQLELALGLNAAETTRLINDSQDLSSEIFDWIIGWNYAQQLAAVPTHSTMADLLSYYSTSQNRCIVASAANAGIGDGATHQQHAGYPARLKGIVSVAAQSRDDNPADYTHVAKMSAKALKEMIGDYTPPAGRPNIYENLATFLDAQGEGFDDNLTVGVNQINRSDAFFLLGGTALAVPNPNLINSLYLADIGSTQANLSGLAGWSGSSFATAVMTGILARLCEIDGNPVGAVDRALVDIRNNVAPLTNNRNAGYYVNMEQF
ncbi:MAG: hypothetical protein KF716_10735 [Anaerolineae bacterium]|nr:hypothetical protein [Anaerolineae bacterium]